MDFIQKEEIKDLMRKKGDYCISIFLPTHRAGREIEQDLIRFDNLVRKAEKELVNKGMRSPEAREMLGPAVDLMKNGFFARHQADGLCIFISRDEFRYFRVPIHFEERLAVGRQFYLKPLVPILNSGKRFFILAVSQKSVRLFDCTEFGISEVQLEGVPHGLREALGYDDTEARLLFRSVAQGWGSRGVGTFHGHGGGIAADKGYLRLYFLRLKESLHPYLKELKTPLVFAGVEYLFPLFKEVNLYSNTLEEAIEGNPDQLEPPELLRRGLQIVGPYFQREQQKGIKNFTELAGTPLSSDRIEQILPGAFAGRVDTLFVDTGIQRWGTFDPDSGSVKVHEQAESDDDDLLDLATAQTFLNGGNVFALDAEQMPGATEAAAIFRY